MSPRGVRHSKNDLHFKNPYDFVNIKLLNHVGKYLSYFSGKLKLWRIPHYPTLSPVPAEYNNIAQIRIHGPICFSEPVFLTMSEIQTLSHSVLAARFQLYTVNNHEGYPASQADDGSFSLLIETDISKLLNKIIQAFDI